MPVVVAPPVQHRLPPPRRHAQARRACRVHPAAVVQHLRERARLRVVAVRGAGQLRGVRDCRGGEGLQNCVMHMIRAAGARVVWPVTRMAWPCMTT